MRYRVAFAVGAAVGYVLGTRAGRERYEQIKKAARAVFGSRAVQGAAGAARERARERGGPEGRRPGHGSRDEKAAKAHARKPKARRHHTPKAHRRHGRKARKQEAMMAAAAADARDVAPGWEAGREEADF